MRRQFIQLAIMVALVTVLQSPARAAQLHDSCSAGQPPTFVGGFALLREALGATMGDPVECEGGDPVSGDAFQRTTTGLAVYRADTNTAMFTTGREHWALTDTGVAHWTGWHGSAAPPGVAAARTGGDVQLSMSAVGTYPSVEAVTIVQPLDGVARSVVVRREAERHLLELTPDCGGSSLVEGQVVFVVSSGAFAAPGSRLIAVPGGPECRIAESRTF